MDSNVEDSKLTKDESVWIAYNAVNPKVTARLSEIELASPNACDPKNKELKGMAEDITQNMATISLSNLAILSTLLVSSESLCPSLSAWPLPKAPHHMRPFSSASDL
jgi:hypothetical protein